jgi:hypothetical protein
MSPTFPPLFLLMGFIALITAASLHGQTSPAAITPEPGDATTRLSQIDLIYQQQLRARHIPLLSKYLTDLQLEAARASDPAPYQQEITRVQGLISSGGVIDLVAAARELTSQATSDQPSPAPPPDKPALTEKVDKSVLSLTPSLARSIQPTPEGSASPTAAAIGRLTWKIDNLPAGSYEVILHYASLDPMAAVPVVVEFAGQKLEAMIDKDRATKNTRSYRLMRLGRLKLEKAASSDELVLTAGGTDTSSLRVRHLHIAPASAP